MKDHFVFIAYKPSSDDYCRGCWMESYPSCFVYEEYDNLESLVQRMADIEEYELSTNEVGFSTYLIHNATTLMKDDGIVGDNDYCSHICFKVNSVLQERKQHREHEEQLLIEKQELEDKQRAIELDITIEQNERAKLQMLAHKYPDELYKEQ